MKHCLIVVGGGHAGVEAAHAACRMGVPCVLVTHDKTKIGEMSCNPAIGGLGKGHLVAEIDALDGLMGRVADRAGIQFRLLNRRRGPAVRGPRAQCDRALYKAAMQSELHATEGLTIVEGEVTRLLFKGNAINGVGLADGSEIKAAAVVLTAGTFLRGVVHIGEEQREGGRFSDAAAVYLADQIRDMGLPTGRLKTGTPPRLASATIDYAELEAQPGDADPVMFSSMSDGPTAPQICCHITQTNARTHAIIADNLGRSAMYGGHIEGVGPRYCPSIEDKVTRFADKDSHQIFLEPEGLDSPLVYPNGISTSLPVDVQIDYVRSIHGLEQAEIVQPGYAIEYDYMDPTGLRADLEVKSVRGLFFAGQINGTTGYEEAAAQGLVAGINAVQRINGQPPVTFSRLDGYIGVLIDDLVTQGVSEPYRMFTSRAEHRLHLRIDNADDRLTPLGIKIGCVSSAREEAFEVSQSTLKEVRALTEKLSLRPEDAVSYGLKVSQDGVRRSFADVVRSTPDDQAVLLEVWPELGALAGALLDKLVADARYAPYLERQEAEVAKLAAGENRILPPEIDYGAIAGLSAELCAKLTRIQPATLGQAARIEGMTPAALARLLVLSKTAPIGAGDMRADTVATQARGGAG
ncbi:MAG: tRNA uridine-5-carboxymethylaminomethyl(34) synthesis enzyme MnmG [Pseudomonadota bacterium]